MPYNKTKGSHTGWKEMILDSNKNVTVQEILNVGIYKRFYKCIFLFSNFFKIGKIVKAIIKTLCCWVYNICRCDIYDKIAQKRGRYIGAKFLYFTRTRLVFFWSILWWIKKHSIIPGATTKKIMTDDRKKVRKSW